MCVCVTYIYNNIVIYIWYGVMEILIHCIYILYACIHVRVCVGLYDSVCIYMNIHTHSPFYVAGWDMCMSRRSERPMDLWSHGEIKTLEAIPRQLPRSCAAGSRMFALHTLLSLQRRQGAKCKAGPWAPQTSFKLLLVLRHGSLRGKCLEGDFAIFGLKRTNSGLCLFIPQLQGRWICRGLGSPRLRWKFFQSQFEADGRCCRVSWLEDWMILNACPQNGPWQVCTNTQGALALLTCAECSTGIWWTCHLKVCLPADIFGSCGPALLLRLSTTQAAFSVLWFSLVCWSPPCYCETALCSTVYLAVMSCSKLECCWVLALLEQWSSNEWVWRGSSLRT